MRATTALQSATNPGGKTRANPFPGSKKSTKSADDSQVLPKVRTRHKANFCASYDTACGVWLSLGFVKTANSTPIFGHQEFGKMFAEFVGLTSDLFFQRNFKETEGFGTNLWKTWDVWNVLSMFPLGCMPFRWRKIVPKIAKFEAHRNEWITCVVLFRLVGCECTNFSDGECSYQLQLWF